VRFTAVLDGTTGGAGRRAAALSAFLREGLSGEAAGETLVFYNDQRDRDRLVELAPTPHVRLVKTGSRRFDHMAEVLVAAAQTSEATLYLFAGGPAGTELAARLACRTGGAVLSDALSIETAPDGKTSAPRILCRKSVYSGHMIGRFVLSARPWCVTIDAGWGDAAEAAVPEHAALVRTVLSDVDETGDADAPPLEDIELVDSLSGSDLADCRFLVVAGSGAGSRQRVARIAEAARRMGAAFGVTRPVAMNAWAPLDRLVGVSGTHTAPAFCIVAGASGAPAFYRGIEKAGFIVAIDTDEHAPIVRNADAVVLDDGVSILEELADIIAARRDAV
jgi:electron transfer flavoprotein alpha subunit